MSLIESSPSFTETVVYDVFLAGRGPGSDLRFRVWAYSSLTLP